MLHSALQALALDQRRVNSEHVTVTAVATTTASFPLPPALVSHLQHSDTFQVLIAIPVKAVFMEQIAKLSVHNRMDSPADTIASAMKDSAAPAVANAAQFLLYLD